MDNPGPHELRVRKTCSPCGRGGNSSPGGPAKTPACPPMPDVFRPAIFGRSAEKPGGQYGQKGLRPGRCLNVEALNLWFSFPWSTFKGRSGDGRGASALGPPCGRWSAFFHRLAFGHAPGPWNRALRAFWRSQAFPGPGFPSRNVKGKSSTASRSKRVMRFPKTSCFGIGGRAGSPVGRPRFIYRALDLKGFGACFRDKGGRSRARSF